jgi:hypothetical protein
MIVHRDITNAFGGSFGSGLAILQFESGETVYCNNACTVRAFEAAFGDCIQEGHTAIIKGHDIVWYTDEFGLTLGGFVPYEDWISAGHPEIEIGNTYELIESEEPC